MAKLVGDGLANPKNSHAIIRAARSITSDCPPRNDLCEVKAVYEAVKHGTKKVPGLAKGLRYVSDPRTFDYFASAAATLRECEAGSCAGDCDDASILVASLLLALGFTVGLRAWGPNPNQNRYTHVYAVVALPKHGPVPEGYSGHGLDTTVEKAYPGWEPPSGRILTYWIEEN